MMNRRFAPSLRVTLLLCLTVLLVISRLSASDHEIVKTDSTEFPFSPGTHLELNLGSGSLDLEIWEQQKVLVTVKRWVSDDSRAKAERRLRELEVEFSHRGNILQVKELARGGKNPFSGLLRSAGVKQTIKSRIDIKIFMPASAPVEIVKTEGTTTASGIGGDLTLKQKKGRIDLTQLSCAKLEIKLGHVFARIAFARGDDVGRDVHINLDVDGGEVNIRDGRIVRLIGKAKKADLYLVQNQIRSGEIRLDSGDLFFNSSLDPDAKLRAYSDTGDMYLLFPSQPRSGIRVETGLGLIDCLHQWPVKKNGSGHRVEYQSSLAQKGMGEFIAEVGDVFVQKRWDQ